MAGTRTFTFLGTGTSVGVPMIGCDCRVCTSTDPRNHRFRASVLITTPHGHNLLIDSGPELRLQLLREKIGIVHSVLYTHYHADHLFGLDDLRIFPKLLDHPLPVYCSEETEEVIRRAFWYAFQADTAHLPAGAIPKLVIRTVRDESFEVLGLQVVPIPLIHARFNVLGYRFDDVAYCTDVSQIPEESWPLLYGLKVLVIDCLRPTPHPAHLSLDQALQIIERVRPERAYLTHIGHDLEYNTVSASLPPHVHMAYDGLKFLF